MNLTLVLDVLHKSYVFSRDGLVWRVPQFSWNFIKVDSGHLYGSNNQSYWQLLDNEQTPGQVSMSQENTQEIVLV